MRISKSLEERIDNMPQSKNKEKWNDLKENINVYITLPTIDKINHIYDNRKDYFRHRQVESLQYERQYYSYVFEIYDEYDYILNLDFFESTIHVNEIDRIQVTQTTKDKIKKIIQAIDKQINQLKKQTPPKAKNHPFY